MNTYSVHTHGWCELLFVINGKGIEMLKGRDRLFEGPELFFYPPELPHNTRSAGDRHYSCYVLSFDDVLLKRDLVSGSLALETLEALGSWVRERNNTCLPMSPEALKGVGSCLDQLHSDRSSSFGGRGWARRLAVENLLLIVNETLSLRVGEQQNPSSVSMIQEACDYIRVHYHEPLTVEELLKVSQLSRSHFFASFKKETGMTFVGFLTQCRLEEAQRLLTTTNESITDIAYLCGFNSYSHFCYTFSKHVGVAPGVFRGTR